LRGIGYFSQAKSERGTVVWPKDEDVAPEALWEKAKLSKAKEKST